MIAPLDPGKTVNAKMQFALRAVAGEFQGSEFPINSERFVVGRGERCDLRLVSQRISRAHCLLVQTETGLVLSDLGSRNGTSLNGQYVTKATKLKLGDQITLDSCVLRLISSPVLPPSTLEPEEDMTRPLGNDELLDWLSEDESLANVERHYRPEAAAHEVNTTPSIEDAESVQANPEPTNWWKRLMIRKGDYNKLPKPTIDASRPPSSTEEAASTAIRAMLNIRAHDRK